MSLSKENIDKIVIGGIYKVDINKITKYLSHYNDSLNTQQYGFWIPVYCSDENKYYMVDTYQISRDCYNGQYGLIDKQLDGLIEGLELNLTDKDRGNWVSKLPFNYYYSSRVELTDDNFDIFSLICNIHEYRIIDESELSNFDDCDLVLNLKLYNEHKYPYGINIVKKNAKINYKKKDKLFS